MRWLAVLSSVLLGHLAATCGAASAAGPFQPFKSDNWTGGAYTNDKTKAFSHCAASTAYQSNILFLVAVNRSMQWSLGFAHPQWSLAPGETIPVTFVFDGSARINLSATAIGKTMVTVPMPDTSDLVSAFRRSYALQAFAKGDQFQFRLDGTSRLLPILVDCVRRNVQPTAPQVAAPSVGSPSPPPPNSRDFQELSQAEATVMLTNLLNSAGVSGYRLETPTQSSPGAGFSLSDGTRGFFIGARGSTKSAEEFATYLIGILSQSCKGDFVTGRQSVPATDGSVIRKVVSTCKSSENMTITESTVIRRPNGFLMNLSQTLPASVSTLNEGRGGKDREAIIDAALRLP